MKFGATVPALPDTGTLHWNLAFARMTSPLFLVAFGVFFALAQRGLEVFQLGEY